MLRLLLVIAGIIPATLWYGAKMIFAVLLRSPSVPCICDEAPRRWARIILRLSGVRVVLENAEVIDPEHAQILWPRALATSDKLLLKP